MNKKYFLPFLCFFIIFIVLTIILLGKDSFSSLESNPSPILLPKFSLRFPFKKSSEKKSEITMIAVGDIMLGRFVNVQILKNNDWRYPFLKTASITSPADIAFANLEAPFVEKCSTTSEGMIFCAKKEAVEGLKYAGFDILSIANNHILNYGNNGFEQTKDLLTQNKILFSDNQLTKLKVKSLVFGFLSFDLVTYPNSPVLEKVKENADKVDILIVSLHWGAEYSPKPNTRQVTLAQQIIDAGAKVIVGHHPHVVQPTETYHQGLIFYSLGNFVFDQAWSEQTKKGKIAKIIFEGEKIKSFEEIPIFIKNSSQPDLSQ